jgi:hypothetical protein
MSHLGIAAGTISHHGKGLGVPDQPNEPEVNPWSSATIGIRAPFRLDSHPELAERFDTGVEQLRGKMRDPPDAPRQVAIQARSMAAVERNPSMISIAASLSSWSGLRLRNVVRGSRG